MTRKKLNEEKIIKVLQEAIELLETTFEFLQRGSRKEAVEIWQWIEAWFQAVPSNLNKRKLKGDL